MKNYSEFSEHELSVSPLTDAERKWLQKVGRLLDKCPTKRLEFVVGGDKDISVVDNTHPNHTNFFDFNFEGAELAQLYFFENGPNISGMCK